MEMSVTQFSKISGLKRKDVIEFVNRRYPLFIIGKDKLDLNMALYISKVMRSDVCCLD